MCAIAGILGLPATLETQQAMLNTMRLRGPDGKGSYTHNDTCLLHTRLAIIDPVGGAQPMILDRGNQRFVLSYNGELYNAQDLRRELLTLGHSFDGHADTEVLLHAWAQWGEAAVEKLNGIFAFAVLEEHNDRLYLVRDRMGVKPLFYTLHRGGLLFASEIKTLLAYPTMRAELDAEGAAQIVYLGPGRAPGSGVFKDIRELEPGQLACYSGGTLSVSRYWRLTDAEHTENFEDTAAYVRFLLMDTFRRQMVSDVPIGAFLSGGLDSSLICAVCAREMEGQGRSLPTFSLDYVDQAQYFTPGKFQPNSDTEYIRIMQQYLDTDHHWSVLTPEELLESLADATVARDLPGMADVDSSLLAFCRQIRPHVKVALSGECADEIFGGYPWYRDPQVRAIQGFPWAQNTARRAFFAADWLAERVDAEDFVQGHYADSLRACNIAPENTPLQKRMKEMTQLNVRWFMQTLLDRKDRMSMYCGLEVRVPYCDHRIAQYLYNVPWEMKEYRGREKGLLRYAMQNLLPQSVLLRKKSPYPKTYHPHYLSLARQALQQVLDQPQAAIFQLVSRRALQTLLSDDSAQPWYGQLMAVPQTIVHMLQIHFWLEHYSVIITN